METLRQHQNDGNITIIANTQKDTNKSQNKEVSVTAWGSVIKITDEGINISDTNNNTIQMNSNGVLINGHLEVTS